MIKTNGPIFVRALVAIFALMLAIGASAQGAWPQYQQNIQGTGLGLGPGTSGAIVGTNSQPVDFVGSPVVGPDGTIYEGGDDGNLYAFTNTNGVLSLKWTCFVYGAVANTPAIASDGTIYVWTDGYVFSITDNGSTGTLNWLYAAENDYNISPVVGPYGYIYLAGGGQVQAIDDEGNSAGEAGSYTVNGTELESTPAFNGSTGYVGDDSGNVTALTVLGGVQWQVNLGSGIQGISIGSDGTVYVNTGGGIYALKDNGSSETQKWVDTAPGATVDSPSIGPDGTIYCANASGALYALTDNHTYFTQKWKETLDSGFAASPVIASDGTIYAGTTGGYFYCLTDEGTSAMTNWSGGLTNNISGGEAIDANGAVYVGQVNGDTTNNFYVFSGADLQSLTIYPSVIAGGGQNATGTVSLGNYVGPSGATVSLQSSTPDVQVPSTVSVSKGNKSATFTITASGVAAQETVTIQGSYGGAMVSDTFTVNPASLSGFKASPTTVTGGTAVEGEVTLLGKAASGGTAVSLSSDNPNVQVPSNVTVPAGTDYLYFSITTSGVPTSEVANLTATLGSSSSHLSIDVNAASPSSFVLTNDNVTGGTGTEGEIRLGSKAGPDGATATLSSGSTDVQVPSNVTVPSGSTYVYFPITTSGVGASENVALAATFGSASPLQTVLTVNPASLTAFKLSSSSVPGGTSLEGEVVLGGKAGSAGDVVTLKSASTDVTVPGTATVPGGSDYVYFTITTAAVNESENVTLTATFGGTSIPEVLTLQPASLTSFRTTSSSVQGGSSTYGVVNIAAKAPTGGLIVNLSSASSLVQMPSTVTVPAGSNYVYFTITTSSVQTSTQVELTATLGSSTQQTTLTLTPAS